MLVGSDARPTAQLYAFERSSGALRWKHTFPLGIGADLLRFGDSVLVASMNAEVAAFDLATGDVLWWNAAGREVAGHAAPVDPALAAGRYYVPWRSGHLDAYDAASGTLLWRQELPAPPNSSALAIDSHLVLGTSDGRLLRFNLETGDLAGALALGAMVYGELVATDGCLLALVAPPGGEDAAGHALACVAFDLTSESWRYVAEVAGSFGTFEPLVVNDLVLVGPRGQLFAIALADGSRRWARDLDGLPRGLATSDAVLYVGNLNGTLTALAWAP